MAYKVKQFRYYNDESSETSRNYPSKVDGKAVDYALYVNGQVFGSCYPVLQLGVQALPGTKFYLNEAVDPVIIGQTGIYELDLANGVQITKIQVDSQSMKKIRDNDNAYLLIDIIYDDGKE